MNASTPRSAHDCVEAIRLAEAELQKAGMDVAEVAVVRAERLIAGTPTCPGPSCWVLTFKKRELLPTEPSQRVGAGGETFVEVDLRAAVARVRGHGE
jgi:hypothetical protein